MKKIYFIYIKIPSSIFNTKYKYIISNSADFRFKNDNIVGLYCWTCKKKIVKEFFKIRDKKPYTVVEKDNIDDEYFQQIKDKYGNIELKRYEFIHYTDGKMKMIEVVTTKNEFVSSTIDHEENLYEFGPEVYNDIDVKVFKDDILEALGILGYVERYYSMYGEETAEIEYINYNRSFGLTMTGKPISKNMDICRDKLNILLYLFHYMFYGE